jgi:hypothetical protein
VYATVAHHEPALADVPFTDAELARSVGHDRRPDGASILGRDRGQRRVVRQLVDLEHLVVPTAFAARDDEVAALYAQRKVGARRVEDHDLRRLAAHVARTEGRSKVGDAAAHGGDEVHSAIVLGASIPERVLPARVRAGRVQRACRVMGDSVEHDPHTRHRRRMFAARANDAAADALARRDGREGDRYHCGPEEREEPAPHRCHGLNLPKSSGRSCSR